MEAAKKYQSVSKGREMLSLLAGTCLFFFFWVQPSQIKFWADTARAEEAMQGKMDPAAEAAQGRSQLPILVL